MSTTDGYDVAEDCTHPEWVGCAKCSPVTAPTPTPDPAAVLALAEDIRREADIADRPGQMGRLRDIAAKIERLAGYAAAVEAVLAVAEVAEGAPLRDLHRDIEGNPFPAMVTTGAVRSAIATAIGGAR